MLHCMSIHVVGGDCPTVQGITAVARPQSLVSKTQSSTELSLGFRDPKPGLVGGT